MLGNFGIAVHLMSTVDAVCNERTNQAAEAWKKNKWRGQDCQAAKSQWSGRIRTRFADGCFDGHPNEDLKLCTVNVLNSGPRQRWHNLQCAHLYERITITRGRV